MNYENLLLLILFIPLMGAILNAFVFRHARVGVVCAISTLAIFIPFVLAVKFFVFIVMNNQTPYTLSLFNWITVPSLIGESFVVPFELTLDHLSGIFVLIITGVGTLIHMYSGEYMIKEKNPYRFFVYLNLFIFSMLILVLGSNMLMTFIGWEGVGLCSYLLIGYWYKEEANSIAAIKAFLFNRVGDVGFLLAMFLCYMEFKTINYSQLSVSLANSSGLFISSHGIFFTLIGLCLLLAVTGKSAQIPLYTWLPDAMAGPTPVSALIHAATMVTAGIYLMTRTSFLLVESSVVMHTIAIIGAATAFLAATIGLAQTDIKKVLAYSTCSQLGYMVLACGVGEFQYGVAHVMSHAFFKACLFLGAGSVIHALHHEQDIRKMGGLFKKMPITGTTFVIATLAIIGFPGFSGFFTKDAILFAAWNGPFGHPLLWIVGLVTAGMTAFYMLRLTWLVFFGTCRYEHPSHIHETNLIITLPLIILAFLSLIGGVVALPQFLTHHQDFITQFLSPILNQAHATMAQIVPAAAHEETSLEISLMVISVVLVLICAIASIFIYRKGPDGGEKFASQFGAVYRFIRDKWRVDEFIHLILVKPLAKVGQYLYSIVHHYLIEGVVKGVPETLYSGTSVVSDAQSGIARNYLKLFFVGLIILGFIVFY